MSTQPLQISQSALLPMPSDHPIQTDTGYTETPDSLTTTGYTTQPAEPAAQNNQAAGFQIAPQGLLEVGNIDLSNRPIVRNEDGTHSSEYSTSFSDNKGREILVPTVVNGKFLTPDGKKPQEGSADEKAMFKRAQQHYEDTHEHMGIFDSADNADAYANAAHNRTQTGNGPLYVAPIPSVVAIPNVGNVQFPASMSLDAIHAACKKLYEAAVQAAKEALGNK
jgi:hypothetical protein